MGAHHGPDRLRSGGPGPSGRTGSSVGVDHPAGAPGPGPHGPRHSCEVLVLYTYRHHHRNNSHCGGRQDHARGPHRQGSGTSSPGSPGPGHGALSLPRHVWQTSPLGSALDGGDPAPSHEPGDGGAAQRPAIISRAPAPFTRRERTKVAQDFTSGLGLWSSQYASSVEVGDQRPARQVCLFLEGKTLCAGSHHMTKKVESRNDP